jgi:hypothetical protein
MLLNEMFNEYPEAYRDVQSDQTVLKFGDIRKTKLTLAQINLLRKMNDQRKIEYAEKIKKVKQQYGASASSAVA